MPSFSDKLLVYAVVFTGALWVVYAFLPMLVRSLIRKIVAQRCEQFARESRQWVRNKLEEGQDKLIPAGQMAVIGHLIQPYLEKLCQWMLGKIDEHGAGPLAESCADACEKKVLQYRLLIALIGAQAVTGLLTLVYLLSGVL